MDARERAELQQAARIANQVVAEWTNLVGPEAKQIRAVSQLMADRYMQQLNEQER